MDVAKALGGTGTRTRVVSMPCWSLFEDQDEAYQLEGEPSSRPLRLSEEVTWFRLPLFLLLSIAHVFFCGPAKSCDTAVYRITAEMCLILS